MIMEKGNIKSTSKIIFNGLQFLNGNECSRNAKVPAILLNYDSPADSHEFAKGERFAFWFKLEDAEWRTVASQLNKNLRELTLWLDKENLKKLKDFLNSIEINKKEEKA